MQKKKIILLSALSIIIIAALFTFLRPLIQINSLQSKLTSIQTQILRNSTKREELDTQIISLREEQKSLSHKNESLREELNLLSQELMNKYGITKISTTTPAPLSAEEPVPCEQAHLPYCTASGKAQAVPELIGSTPEERHNSLLAAYGLEDLIQPGIDFEKKYRINKFLPTCIAKADTSLGRFLKTANNLGNVGNTDSGKTRTFDSLTSGYEAIFKTLNNKYLGSHTQLWQLSGKYNPGGPNYATSKDSRETNVLNCLFAIYGKTINNTFEFRI